MSILSAILIAQASAPAAPPPVVLPPPLITGPPAIETVALPPPPLTSVFFDGKPASPAGNPGLWVTTNDYPPRALREERAGTVGFRLTIDPFGRVSACDITSSSGSPDLDEVTCTLVTQRARFNPAKDNKGKATTGSYSSRVRWIIPEDPDPVPMVGPDGRFLVHSVTFSFFIEPDGTTSDCVVTVDDVAETLAVPEGPCVAKQPYKPYLDASGKPVRKRASVTVKSTVEDPPKP
jgi:TonB family protein